MTAFAVSFLSSTAVFAAAVWRAERGLARLSAVLCAVSYLGFLVLLIAGGVRV